MLFQLPEAFIIFFRRKLSSIGAEGAVETRKGLGYQISARFLEGGGE